MSDPIAPNERRAHPREAASLWVRAFYGTHDAMWADGVLIDMSKGGCKLKIGAIYPLPARIRLLQVRGGVVYDARVRWRRGDLTGIAFEGTRTLEGCEDADLARLLPIWHGLLAMA